MKLVKFSIHRISVLARAHHESYPVVGEAYSEGVGRDFSGSSGELLGGAARRRRVSLDVHAHGPGGVSVRWGCVFPGYRVSARLPVQASQGDVQDEDLPLQYQFEWADMSGYIEGQLVTGVDGVQGAAECVFAADGPESRGPAGAYDCTAAAS